MAESAPNQTPLAPRLHGVAPPPSPSLSLLPHLSLSLSYANTRNIFQMLFAFALHTIFAWRARCATACLFTFFNFPRSLCCRRWWYPTHSHTHTHTVWHTRTCYTLHLYSRLCVAYIFIIFFMWYFLSFFFFCARCPTILTACQKEVVLYSVPRRTPPTPLATNPSMPAPLPLLLLLLPSKCLHSKLPMGQWTVCVCLAPTSCWAPSPRLLISSLTWLLGFFFLSSFCICQLATPTLTVLCRN